MKQSPLTLSFALLCALLLLVIGCSTPPRREKFVPPPFSVDVHHPERLSVSVTSSPNAFPYSTAMSRGDEVFTPDLKFAETYREAIIDAIRSCQLYVIADDHHAADVILDVTIRRMSDSSQSVGVTQGTRGAPSAAALIVTEWSLKRKSTGAVICQKDITTSNAHDAPDYILGGMITAQRNAIEGMAATNIRQGVEWMARRTASQ